MATVGQRFREIMAANADVVVEEDEEPKPVYDPALACRAALDFSIVP